MRLLFVALVGHALDNGSGHVVTFPLRSPHPGWPGLENVRDTHGAGRLGLRGPCSAYRGAALWLPGKPRARRCGGAGLPLGSDSLAGFTNGWAYRVRFRLAFAGRFVRITYTLVPWTRLARPAIVVL